MKKIVYYRDKCIGCGVCFENQPGLWRMSKKDGKANLLNSTPKKEVHVLAIGHAVAQQTQQLTLLCPVKIIKML